MSDTETEDAHWLDTVHEEMGYWVDPLVWVGFGGWFFNGLSTTNPRLLVGQFLGLSLLLTLGLAFQPIRRSSEWTATRIAGAISDV